jgi:hypothetical protein
MERINVRLDERLKAKVDSEARLRGLRPSDSVRKALEDHVRSRKSDESAYDVAKRLGMLRSAKGLPADLSTNPKHTEGLGSE